MQTYRERLAMERLNAEWRRLWETGHAASLVQVHHPSDGCQHHNVRAYLDRTSNMRPGDMNRAAPSLAIVDCGDCGEILDIRPVTQS